MSNLPVKVLLVEDSPVVLAILQRVLQSSSEITVVGTASHGQEALKLIPELEPDVICTDLYMVGMNGIEFTKQVMTNYPRPILVISNAVGKKDENNVFQLLQAGAIDVFPKPSTGLSSDYEKTKNELIAKIKIVSGVTVFTKSFKKLSSVTEGKNISNSQSLFLDKKSNQINKSTFQNTNIKTQQDYSSLKILAIGVSTGGPKTLHKIFTQLPKKFPLPIICTLHISPGFLSGLVTWLNQECSLTIKIAQAGEFPSPGIVYFAPDNYHLEVNSEGKFSISQSNIVDGHCPSVTVMFESIAKLYRQKSMAILLTGMGKDGAKGMETIAQTGGITIAQDEESSIIFGMPKEAIALGAVKHILSLSEIAPFLLENLKISN